MLKVCIMIHSEVEQVMKGDKTKWVAGRLYFIEIRCVFVAELLNCF